MLLALGWHGHAGGGGGWIALVGVGSVQGLIEGEAGIRRWRSQVPGRGRIERELRSAGPCGFALGRGARP